MSSSNSHLDLTYLMYGPIHTKMYAHSVLKRSGACHAGKEEIEEKSFLC